jgi:hypothetical protein
MLIENRAKTKYKPTVRAIREIALAFTLGGVPVILNSETSAQLKATIDLLLAAPFLISYYVALLTLFFTAAIVSFKWRFNSSQNQARLMAIHRFLGEVGGSFLTAGRTGLGAMLGFTVVWHATEPDSLTLKNIVETAWIILCMTALCITLASAEEVLRDPRRSATTKPRKIKTLYPKL